MNPGGGRGGATPSHDTVLCWLLVRGLVAERCSRRCFLGDTNSDNGEDDAAAAQERRGGAASGAASAAAAGAGAPVGDHAGDGHPDNGLASSEGCGRRSFLGDNNLHDHKKGAAEKGAASSERAPGAGGGAGVGMDNAGLKERLNELTRENAELRSNLAGTEEASSGMHAELQRMQQEYTSGDLAVTFIPGTPEPAPEPTPAAAPEPSPSKAAAELAGLRGELEQLKAGTDTVLATS